MENSGPYPIVDRNILTQYEFTSDCDAETGAHSTSDFGEISPVPEA